MNEEDLIKKHEENEPLATIDGVTVFGRDVDEENHPVYIIEKDGEKQVVLYNEIDQKQIPRREDFSEMDISIHKRLPAGGEEVLHLRNYDDEGKEVPLDIKKERDDFLKATPVDEAPPIEITPLEPTLPK